SHMVAGGAERASLLLAFQARVAWFVARLGGFREGTSASLVRGRSQSLLRITPLRESARVHATLRSIPLAVRWRAPGCYLPSRIFAAAWPAFVSGPTLTAFSSSLRASAGLPLLVR